VRGQKRLNRQCKTGIISGASPPTTLIYWVVEPGVPRARITVYCMAVNMGLFANPPQQARQKAR